MKTNSRTTVVCGPIRHSLLTDLLDGDYFQKYFQFWVFEAHSQYYDLSLSTDAPQIQQEDSSTFSVNSNPGIIVTRDEDNLNLAPKVYLSSKATHNVSVLILVRGYAAEVPVPGLINRNG